MPGWRGTILRIDLTSEKITKQPLDRLVARNFIGGRGFNSLTLFKEVKPGIDPHGLENVLCLAPGALKGTGLGLSSRIEVSTLSPYSGILGDGNAGGDFPTFLKKIHGKDVKVACIGMAKEHFGRALEIFRKVRGEEDPSTAKVRNNFDSLANVHGGSNLEAIKINTG